MTEPLTEGEIERIWRKARPIPGRDPHLYRVAPDVIQSMIRRDRYNLRGEHGWRIEHDRPVSYRDQSILTAMTLVQRELHADPWSSNPASMAKKSRS